MTRLTKELIAWSIAAVLGGALYLDELLGIIGVWKLQPITVDSVNNPFLAGVIYAAFPVAMALWYFHLKVNRSRD